VNTLEVCVGLLLAAVIAFLSVCQLSSVAEPRITTLEGQRMCPYCGRITSRLQEACLECGKQLVA
jgi:hypothetical protein